MKDYELMEGSKLFHMRLSFLFCLELQDSKITFAARRSQRLRRAAFQTRVHTACFCQTDGAGKPQHSRLCTQRMYPESQLKFVRLRVQFPRLLWFQFSSC